MAGLGLAPPDSDGGEFSYQSIEVGSGPCSVSLLDLANLPEQVGGGGRVAAHG